VRGSELSVWRNSVKNACEKHVRGSVFGEAKNTDLGYGVIGIIRLIVEFSGNGIGTRLEVEGLQGMMLLPKLTLRKRETCINDSTTDLDAAESNGERYVNSVERDIGRVFEGRRDRGDDIFATSNTPTSRD
jgi:hypothetical protein